jgi:hypothetical protein
MKTKIAASLSCALVFLATSCSTMTTFAPMKGSSSTAPALSDFKLVGDLGGEVAAFTLTGNVRVENPSGGSLKLLAGPVALTAIGTHPNWQIQASDNKFIATFDRSGVFPIQIKFNAAVGKNDGWSAVDFRVAPSILQPIVLQGLPADTQFQFADAARPERTGTNFTSFLQVDGTVRFSWKQARPEAEGKLFYAAEMESQISISPGLMRQVALLVGKVMQGEMNQITLRLHGDGEVTRVAGDQVLAWNVVPGTNSVDRKLVVQFNQPQKDEFAIQVQTQTPLGAFPQSADAMQIQPEGATRFAGHFRIVNDGAVRLEVLQASGLSQISPEQFPESDATRAAFRLTGSQRFAYQFSSPDFALKIQADQILPEVSVSQLLAYNLGDSELAIDAEIELDIRDAPLREVVLNVPKGYSVANINAAGMIDDILSEPDGEANSELRIVYGQPVSDRQVIQLRLERNQALGETNWTLPHIEVAKAKSTRGFVAVSADAGFRLTAERTQSLTETPTAFFPRKVAGIQTAFRLSDADWQATMRVERLPQTVTADVFHLFSIGEGIAYGSSVMNYVVSGAPVAAFRVELSDEYFNVEFTGKDIRGWQKTADGYIVQLNTPVAGAYTLLATYERPFKPAGETLAFTGARPIDAQTESGHTIIISAYQFQVKAENISPGLVELEPAEVPSEYRLFFDAPILKAYQYSARPFDLKLALSPLAQGDSLNQVVDRASLDTSISKEGQVLTTVRYFVKNRGNPNFRLTLPDGTDLWSATVNGATVVPVIDGKDNLIPLPQRADPDTVLTIDLKLAATNSTSTTRVTIAAPIVTTAPVMLAQWKLTPDEGQRLTYLKGTLTPVGGVVDVSGFAQLARLFKGNENGRAAISLCIALILLLLALLVWCWSAQAAVYKFSVRQMFGTVIGLAAVVLAAFALLNLMDGAGQEKSFSPRDVTFLAPVQQAGSALTVEVANVSETASTIRFGTPMLLLLLALVVWVWSAATCRRFVTGRHVAQSESADLSAHSKFGVSRILGWLLLAWAALRWQNGAAAFFVVVAAFLFLHVVIPALKRLWQLPGKPESELPPPPPEESCAPRAVALLIGLLLLGGTMSGHCAGVPALAETVTQQIRIEDKFALATAKIRWQAEKGQVLPLLFEPAVMTKVIYPTSALKLVQTTDNSKRVQQLVAQSSGTFDIEVQYQIQVAKLDTQNGFALPVPAGLINQLTLTLVNLDVDVYSPQAVSIQRTTVGTNTVATLVLAPGNNIWVSWQPRSRDVQNEKPVFYAEISQLYVPSAGVIEGLHQVSIRPAQGQLSELIFNVPTGATITDVSGGGQREDISAANANSQALIRYQPIVSLWRFDPDTRKLRVTLNPAQSKPFNLVIRSQVATGTLPFEQKVGLISVDGAAGQIGLLGVATGNEVQLDDIGAENFSPINLEDFPDDVVQPLAVQFPGLTVRRAFRYSDMNATAVVKASPVEPDVRVETQDTLSLGEDRTVLASTANVTITRAGIFKLSFVMPPGFDVESISGAALSHWTELKTNADRVITLNLSGKTDGEQQFTISLSGPGVKATNGWTVPQIVLREANKQRGTLLIVPEQGMRLSATNSAGVTQLDPQKSDVRQQGVLAFRVLQSPWNLALDIAQVDAWVQVTSLQNATVNEAQVKIAANLQYQIENTGLKAFHVLIPTNAIGVNFQGDQVAGFQQVEGAVTNGLQEWEIKLQRRVIGQYMLQLTYQTPMPDQSPETILRGVQAADVNTQRGFVTVQSGGRLQVRADDTPASLQPAEWQSIPRALQQDLETVSASFAYRLVEPDFQLPLKLERHEAVKLLPARVNNITFTSVISDAGVMLTEVRLEILPGDKRLLHLALPDNVNAKFWFAFVNQNGVWPWREGDDILIPLEQQSRGDQAIPVEIYFSSDAGNANSSSLDLDLIAPKFDLPLEDITWRVFLNDKWQVKKWNGTLQFQQQEIVSSAGTIDLQSYLSSESSLQREKTQEAQQMLTVGNTALQNGDPQQARRAFQSAYGLSRNDAAFNEDARVQLNNLKVQQALVGLNERQSAVNGDNAALGGKFRGLRNSSNNNYTQQDAKQIIDSNTADENAAFMKLAERLVQQQDAAVSSPAVIRANIPEQGRLLTFKRSVDVNREADLNIGLEATAAKAASWGVRFFILLMTALVLGGFGLLACGLKNKTSEG